MGGSRCEGCQGLAGLWAGSPRVISLAQARLSLAKGPEPAGWNGPVWGSLERPEPIRKATGGFAKPKGRSLGGRALGGAAADRARLPPVEPPGL